MTVCASVRADDIASTWKSCQLILEISLPPARGACGAPRAVGAHRRAGEWCVKHKSFSVAKFELNTTDTRTVAN